MKFLSRSGALAALLAATTLLDGVAAQASTPTIFTDAKTGIVFNTWSATDAQTAGGMTYGFALPSTALTTDANEYVGYLQCASKNGQGTGWCGISLGGTMTNKLLLMAWPNGGEILTSFRWSSGYDMPTAYAGDAKITQISSTINATHYTLLYRCQNCFQWNHNGATGSASTSAGFFVLGWAQAFTSPTNPSCPASLNLVQHDNQGIHGTGLDPSIANPSYSAWAALATKTVTGSCGGSTATSAPGSTTTRAPTGPTGVPVPSGTYDYIVIGAGAGGIPLADKLSEAGKSVLLIEKGPPSSGRWGGTVKPPWLEGTNLTRFDVPGLCNQIWHDSAGIACQDTDQMAGCVLGGGTAINAALWWKPYAQDWDYNFPAGWKSADVAAATSRVFSRIPGTTTPSQDGKVYLTDGFNALAGGLRAAGWKELDLNANPNSKNRTFGKTPYMYSGGERGGPMATYLVSASKRSNFKLWTRTAVKRVVRSGGHITGVEVEPYVDGGFAGTVGVTAVTGRVVLAAGTFGSAKLLLRSGIGPADQLEIVKSSTDGPTMIANSSWISLPVGYNLEDHTNTDTVATHPDVQFYDFYEAYDDPNVTDKNAYLQKRSGILAQSAPNIGPLFFEEIKGADGITRQMQYTARMEGSNGTPDGKGITISQYLGRGATSRGRMTIQANLGTVVSTVPYLRDQNDVEAVIKGIENVQAALKNVPNLVWTFPAAGTSVRDFVNNMLVSYSNRRANHWIGTNKLGTKDGRSTGGDAVVDVNAKVYGTDNLFVVDASIFPGMVTTNPSSYIVVASEHAAARILALAPATGQALYAQCGGSTWTGSFQCAAGLTCTFKDSYYSQPIMLSLKALLGAGLAATAVLATPIQSLDFTGSLAPRADPSLVGYLGAFFLGADPYVYLYLSNGNSPTSFRALNSGSPVIRPTKGTGGVRDPAIVEGGGAEKGKKWYIVGTDLDIGKVCAVLFLFLSITTWDAAQRQGSKGIFVWESTDLVNWTGERLVVVENASAGMVWAPEAIWDPTKGQYLVHWASKFYGASDPNHTGAPGPIVIRYAYTSDFRTFSTPQTYIDKSPTNIIDLNILPTSTDGRSFVRFLKDESLKTVFVEVSTTGLFGTWTRPGGASAIIASGVEGPAAYWDNQVAGRAHVLLDFYGDDGYRPYETANVASNSGWTASSRTGFPSGLRHGGVLPVNQTLYNAVTARWG
ncbi:hypothetical protein EsH8_V_000309 [Colletotrichum jinshuiense]